MRIVSLILFVAQLGSVATAADLLPGTKTLTWPEPDLSGRLMDGAHQFVERKIAEAPARRGAYWKRDFSSPDAYAKSIAANRERLRSILGVVDARLPAGMEQYGDDVRPALVAESASYRVLQVRWPVLEGVWGAGLLVQPKTRPVAHVVVVPDAGQTPEQWFGLASSESPAAATLRQLAASGVELVIPVTVSREKLVTDDTNLRRSDQTWREWIYRQAFHMGRHVIGYEVQTVLAAIDGFRARHGAEAPVGVAGHAEGGLVAFYAAALDPRIRATLVSGYFDSRQDVWSEPIYRNVWSLLREFGDAEIAGLVLPRDLVIEHSPGPDIAGHKGDWRSPEFARVEAEVRRVVTTPGFARPAFVHGESGARVGPFSSAAVAGFARGLGIASLASPGEAPRAAVAAFDPRPRHLRYVKELEGHVQRLIAGADHVRDRFFPLAVMPELADNKWSTERRHALQSAEKFVAGAARYRQLFLEEGMGRFDEPLGPFNARTRKVAETAQWIAYDVVLDVWPEVIAWGVLVLPKDLKPGERRPVVVCQHGRNGVPRDTVDGNKTAYNNFAGVLAERGFVTFAPHNLYRGEDRYRWLSRKANSVQASLFSFILAQHDQILRWLGTQPFVDPARIAFYGLSYGGETAVRVPTILEGYALSICSGDFNQWTRKVAATDQPFTFMRTIEWEMPYWNLGHTFDYAEMAYLMLPRPFMVERGHYDRVGRDAWVAHEYGKVRWLYATLGLADRTEIEFFPGGHSINGEGTFDFLHRHLRWPKPQR
jgi:dienelactone hydrolase